MYGVVRGEWGDPTPLLDPGGVRSGNEDKESILIGTS